MELSVEKEKVLENGILYKLDILKNDQLYFADNETGEKSEKRMHLGYFYVQANKIYLIQDMEINTDSAEKDMLPIPLQRGENINLDMAEEELIRSGKVVCQEKPQGDMIDPEEKGWHEGIGIIGDRCIFGRYANYIETDWWEDFTWQKGLGLVEYKSGRGAFADSV